MIKNNNPGNIRYYPEYQWLGQTGQDYRGFSIFSAMVYGVRAMIKIIWNDVRAGRDTISQIIYEYAPPNENDTEKYIRDVTSWTGYNRNTRININDFNQVKNLVKAMIRKETGVRDFSDSYIQAGYQSWFPSSGTGGSAPSPGSPGSPGNHFSGSLFIPLAIVGLSLYLIPKIVKK